MKKFTSSNPLFKDFIRFLKDKNLYQRYAEATTQEWKIYNTNFNIMHPSEYVVKVFSWTNEYKSQGLYKNSMQSTDTIWYELHKEWNEILKYKKSC